MRTRIAYRCWSRELGIDIGVREQKQSCIWQERLYELYKPIDIEWNNLFGFTLYKFLIVTQSGNVGGIQPIGATYSKPEDTIAFIVIGCPTSSVAQANLTMKINFNISHSFSPSDILTIDLHAFLQSLYPFRKDCVQGILRDFRQNNPNMNQKSRCISARYPINFPLTYPKREKSEGAKSGEEEGWDTCFIRLRPM
jgi:hypothetical protein